MDSIEVANYISFCTKNLNCSQFWGGSKSEKR